MEVISSIVKTIDTAVPFYNEILGLENKVIADGKQISKIIAQLDFVNGVRNAKLRNMLQKVQDKYTMLVALIGKLTEEKRKYMEKMMYIVSNKQKTLQIISGEVIKNARNPLNKIVRDQLQGRELLSLMRSYYEQSVNFNKFADARSVVNHRLNALYSSLNSLQMEITRALHDFMNEDTFLRIDQTSQQMSHNIRRLTDLEGSLVSAEQAILTADTKLNIELDVPDFAVLKRVGGGYLEDLLKGFSALQAGQTGGAVDPARVALLPGVVPKIHDVDMVSFGGILQQRLNECQNAFTQIRKRLNDWADFDNVFLSVMNKGAGMDKLAEQVKINMNTFKLLQDLSASIAGLSFTNGSIIKDGQSTHMVELIDVLKFGVRPLNINVIESFVKQYCDWVVSIFRNWQCDPSDFTSGASHEELKKLKETVLTNLKIQIEQANEALKAIKANNVAPVIVVKPGATGGGKKKRSSKKRSSSKKHRGGAKKKRSSKKRSSTKKHRGGKKKSSKRRSSKKRSSARR